MDVDAAAAAAVNIVIVFLQCQSLWVTKVWYIVCNTLRMFYGYF